MGENRLDIKKNVNMRQTGKLMKNENGEWVIWYKKDSDLTATDGGNIPIHPNHSFWLKIWGKEGETFPFELTDEGLAILKPKESSRTYPQD